MFCSQVQREVEQQIQNLRTLFRQRLTEFPSSIDDQKLFIRYLHSLDSKADPAWDCIIHQKAALIDVLRSCVVDRLQHQQQQQQQQSKYSKERYQDIFKISLVISTRCQASSS